MSFLASCFLLQGQAPDMLVFLFSISFVAANGKTFLFQHFYYISTPFKCKLGFW